MKITLSTIFIFFLFFTAFTQDKVSDFELISSFEVNETEGNQGFFKGLLSVYNKHISDQILNDCIYEHSCSNFSQGAFSQFGLIKGYFLTIDRLTRCNRASLVQIAPVRINNQGQIRDHWTDYTFRK